MLNEVNLIGRVGRDVEVRTSQSGKKIAVFSIATSEKYKGEEKTEWHNIVIYNEKLVDVAEQYVKKGDLLYVKGKLAYTKYTDKSGNEKQATNIVLAFNCEIKMLGNKSGASKQGSKSVAEKTHDYEGTGAELYDDEIPF